MSRIGTVRIREDEDSYVSDIYVKVGEDSYRVLYIDTFSGEILEAQVSNHVAERWPVKWEPK